MRASPDIFIRHDPLRNMRDVAACLERTALVRPLLVDHANPWSGVDSNEVRICLHEPHNLTPGKTKLAEVALSPSASKHPE